MNENGGLSAAAVVLLCYGGTRSSVKGVFIIDSWWSIGFCLVIEFRSRFIEEINKFTINFTVVQEIQLVFKVN